MLQSGNLIPFLTAAENVELAIVLAGGGRAGQGAQRAAARGRAREAAATSSRAGYPAERRNASRSAVALANEPDLLLADEATGELDAATAERSWRSSSRAWRERGLAVLYVTHSDELAAQAQRRLRLGDGRVLPA